jgi:prepilin-type N-terminal cleavage/methylation domain-containing protein
MAWRKLHKDQRGFTLIEVMSAALVLSIFVTGIGAFWIASDRRINSLTLRQKTIFAASSELERLTTLYDTTGFGVSGPTATTGYNEVAALPSTRLTYPTALSPVYVAAGQDFITTSASTFVSGDSFELYVSSNLLSSLNRSYRWIDKAQGIAGRVSWTTTALTPSSCAGGDGCGCLDFTALLAGSCYRLDLYLEYPFRMVTGSPVAASNLQTVVLSTLVGRHT